MNTKKVITGSGELQTAEVTKDAIESIISTFEPFTRNDTKGEIILDCSGFEESALLDIQTLTGVDIEDLRDQYVLFWSN